MPLYYIFYFLIKLFNINLEVSFPFKNYFFNLSSKFKNFFYLIKKNIKLLYHHKKYIK